MDLSELECRNSPTSNAENRAGATTGNGLDIGVAGMDGYLLARKTRAESQDSSVRLVAIASYGRAEDHGAIMTAGIDEHLDKPIHPKELDQLLRKAR